MVNMFGGMPAILFYGRSFCIKQRLVLRYNKILNSYHGIIYNFTLYHRPAN